MTMLTATRSPAPPLADLIGRLGHIGAGATWTSVPGGRTNRMWHVADGNRRLAVKQTAGRAAGPVFPNDPDREARLLPDLAGLAPRKIAFVPEAECLIYEWLDGPTWSVGMGVDLVATALRQLHGRRLALAEAPSLVEEARDLARRLSRSALDRLGSAPLTLELPARTAVLHGDPVPANLIVTNGGPRLIDWQCAALGHPARDIAVFLSPAMQSLYGSGPLTEAQQAEFLSAFDGDIRADYLCSAPLLHWRLAAYCLWRAELGEPDYAEAAEAELDLLERLCQQHQRPAGDEGQKRRHDDRG